MSEKHLNEAARLLAEIGACLPDSQALAQGREKLAKALEEAERRGQRNAKSSER
jgi:hypothetical protein